MSIQEIGQQLLNELNEELTKNHESSQLAKGAIQGVQLFFTRIQEEQNLLDGKSPEEKKERVFKGFAEGRSK